MTQLVLTPRMLTVTKSHFCSIQLSKPKKYQFFHSNSHTLTQCIKHQCAWFLNELYTSLLTTKSSLADINFSINSNHFLRS